MIDTIKLMSFNVRGLRNRKKRSAVFSLLKEQQFDLIALQETYLTFDKLREIETEWKGKVVLSEGGINSQGLLILLSKKLQENYKIKLLHKDKRIVLVYIENNDRKIIIGNIYAPCNLQERMLFLEQLKNIIRDHSNIESQLVLLGDFNTVTDNDLDIISGGKHNEASVIKLNEMIVQLSLHDAWRNKHPHARSFTWSRRNPFVARRLDYIFIHTDLLPYLQHTEIKSYSFSDHRAVVGNFSFSFFKRGPSLFKMNTSLFHNKAFVNMIKKRITEIEVEHGNLNPHLLWEYLKIEVKEATQQFCRFFHMNKRKKLNELTQELNMLEESLPYEHNKDVMCEKITQLKQHIEIEVIQKVKGAQLRAGIKWIEEGERCSRYFLSLEKSRSSGNVISKIKDPVTNSMIYDEIKILENIAQYYEKLYTEEWTEENSVRNYSSFITDIIIPQVSLEDSIDCDKELSESEILHALSKMKNGSAPGSDGIPTEFYKVFWEEIKKPLMSCYNYSLEQGHLCITQKQGIITLLQKDKNGNREDLSNWRPITLTNTDYKILAKTFALRLSPVIQYLVSEDQKCFIKGRNIAEVVREINDLIEHQKNLIDDSFVLSIDYRKAFDSISTIFLKETFKSFGFGTHFCKWMSVILEDRKASVKNGGYLSRDFDMQRGVRQGCPISPMIFVLAVEILALKIRQDIEIKGIVINRIKFVIKQYADDTTLFLKDIKDLKRVLNKINEFSLFSGLSLNENKTKLMSFSQNNIDEVRRLGINVVSEMKILGIFFNLNMCASLNKKNWENRLENLKRIISVWQKRDLSIMGKIVILKTYGISQFIYIIQSLVLPEHILKEATRICFNFIWKKKVSNKKAFEKVKRKVVCNEYDEGGLKMIDLYALQKSFLLNWMKNLYDSNEYNWKTIPWEFYRKMGGARALNYITPRKNLRGANLIVNLFWKEALNAWVEFNWTFQTVGANVSISDTVFNNFNIQYKEKTLFVERFIARNIFSVGDFCIGNKVMSINEFKNKYGSYNGIELDFNVVRNALTNVNICKEGSTNRKDFWGKMQRRDIYKRVRSIGQVDHVQRFWERKQFKFDSSIWKIPFISTKETRLRLLQWKILHNIYPTRILLQKMKIADSQKCIHCDVVDYSEHFFFHCKKVTPLWKEIEKVIEIKIGECLRLGEREVMLGITDIPKKTTMWTKWVNHVILVGKMVVSKIKYGPKTLYIDTLWFELQKRNLV